jgi:chemotaxis protein CheX
MQLMEEEIRRLGPMIWESVLRLPLDPAAEAPPAEVPPSGERNVTSFVYISGAWNGAVSLDCGRSFATLAASIMFGLQNERPSAADIQDALGELANMVGGNIKGLCSGKCRLSLPVVVEGASGGIWFPGTRLITKVPFVSGRYSITVSLHKRDEKSLS